MQTDEKPQEIETSQQTEEWSTLQQNNEARELGNDKNHLFNSIRSTQYVIYILLNVLDIEMCTYKIIYLLLYSHTIHNFRMVYVTILLGAQ